jgi:RNA polymerase sigma factor (sigma-70 family)
MVMIDSARAARALFEAQLPVIQRVIDGVARRHRLSPPDAEDFKSTALVRLLENECAALGTFHGRSSLTTFLCVVVERIYIDFRRACWGNWRPSSRARELGPCAMHLERLVYRDRFTFEEARELLRINAGVTLSAEELYALFVRLPTRQWRRPVSDPDLAQLPAPEVEVLPVLSPLERRRIAAALGRAVARLEPGDRRIIALRFGGRLTIAEIARQSGLCQRKLYRHIRSILNRLRDELQAAGVRSSQVKGALDGFELPWALLRGSKRVEWPAGGMPRDARRVA